MKITDQIAAPDRDTILIDSSGRPTELFSDWMEHITNKVNISFVGTSSPEGVITADIGSYYQNLSGSTGTSFYIKESGTGNTGWVAQSGVDTNYIIAYLYVTVAAGTPTIANSFNIASITDLGVCRLRVTMDNAAASTNYVISGSLKNSVGGGFIGLDLSEDDTARTTTVFEMYSTYATGTLTDSPGWSIMVVGG